MRDPNRGRTKKRKNSGWEKRDRQKKAKASWVPGLFRGRFHCHRHQTKENVGQLHVLMTFDLVRRVMDVKCQQALQSVSGEEMWWSRGCEHKDEKGRDAMMDRTEGRVREGGGTSERTGGGGWGYWGLGAEVVLYGKVDGGSGCVGHLSGWTEH